MEATYLLLGSNIGDRMDFLRQGVDLLCRDAGSMVAVSSIYESEPWGFDDPCWFLNQVAALKTDLAPRCLLEITQRIEQSLGRRRTHSEYQSRTMDIDILLYGNHVIISPELVVPHPRMTERMFALQPMAELAPDMQHPVLHQTMAYLRERCVDKKRVRRIYS